MPAVCLKFWTKPRLSFPKPLPRLFFLNKYRHYFPGEHFPKRIPRLFSKEYKLGNFCLSFSTYLTAFHDFWQQVWELSRHDHQPESHQSSFNNMSESVSYKPGQAMIKLRSDKNVFFKSYLQLDPNCTLILHRLLICLVIFSLSDNMLCNFGGARFWRGVERKENEIRKELQWVQHKDRTNLSWGGTKRVLQQHQDS